MNGNKINEKHTGNYNSPLKKKTKTNTIEMFLNIDLFINQDKNTQKKKMNTKRVISSKHTHTQKQKQIFSLFSYREE